MTDIGLAGGRDRSERRGQDGDDGEMRRPVIVLPTGSTASVGDVEQGDVAMSETMPPGGEEQRKGKRSRRD